MLASLDDDRAHQLARRRRYYHENAERLRELNRAYDKTPRGVESLRRKRAAYALKHPGRSAAAMAVHRALKAGKIAKGKCEVCGTEKTEAHHDNYLEKLNVRWLCRRHHRLLHVRKLGHISYLE